MIKIFLLIHIINKVMSQIQVKDFIFLLVVLYVLYFAINKMNALKDSFESSEKNIGQRSCSENAINSSILDYIFTPFHFVR